MSYNNVALAVIPSGIKSSIVYSLIGGNMTFTRGSSATRRNKDGLIEYVDTSVPRLDYDGAIPHLLLEPQRSNLQVYSEDLSNAAWSKTNATITTNAEIAPDGNSTANKFDAGTATGEHHVNDVNTTVAGTNYTFSIFVKSGNEDTIRVFMYRSGTPFTTIAALRINLNTQTIIENVNTAGTENKVENYGNGWYRISISGEALTTGTVVRVQPYESGLGTFTGNNKYFYLWGAQMEVGGYVTSYIPNLTTGSSTRAVEGAVNVSAEFNDAEGVLFAEIKTQSLIPQANAYLGISDNSATNMLNIRFSTSGLIQIHNNGTGTSNRVYGETLTSDYIKIAVKYGRATSDYKVFINGEEKTIFGTFVATVMNGLNTFDLAYPTDTFPFLGMVRQAVVFDSALTDAQLIELTR